MCMYLFYIYIYIYIYMHVFIIYISSVCEMKMSEFAKISILFHLYV